MQGLAAVLAKVMVHEQVVRRTVVDKLAPGKVPWQGVHMDPCWVAHRGLCCGILC